MVAIIVEQPGRLVLKPEPNPEAPGPGEVLVAITRAGICGSDIHILHGRNPFARYPRIIGHELAGRVAAIGAGVTGLAVDQPVVIDPVVSCGQCYPCRIGRSNVCSKLEVIGVHRDGGFRRHLTAPAANVIPIPAHLSPAIAALAEPFSIAANVTSRTGLTGEDTVLIFGAGPIGLTILLVAKMRGARAIIVDPEASRLERARGFGADVVINPNETDVAAAVKDENDGLGPTVVIDGAGVPALLDLACRVASPAARIGLLGITTEPSTLVQQMIVGKELTIAGSRLNRRLVPQVVEWLASGKIDAAAMITQTFAADDALAAFELVEKHPEQTIKVQLAFDA